MALVQVTDPTRDPQATREEDTEVCHCCVNRLRVHALRRQRHADWAARRQRRTPSSPAQRRQSDAGQRAT